MISSAREAACTVPYTRLEPASTESNEEAWSLIGQY